MTTRKIKKNAVANAKIKNGAVESAKIADGSVTRTDLAEATLPYGRIVHEARASSTVAVPTEAGNRRSYPLQRDHLHAGSGQRRQLCRARST